VLFRSQLDNLSVDSYWIEEEELNNIKKEKESHPANPNYKSVYEKVVEKSKSKQQQQQQKSPDNTTGEEIEFISKKQTCSCGKYLK